jgi:hypothetical protein
VNSSVVIKSVQECALSSFREKTHKNIKLGSMVQVLECLLNKHKTLNSIPRITKNQNMKLYEQHHEK